jgi:hypothetical protein
MESMKLLRAEAAAAAAVVFVVVVVVMVVVAVVMGVVVVAAVCGRWFDGSALYRKRSWSTCPSFNALKKRAHKSTCFDGIEHFLDLLARGNGSGTG